MLRKILITSILGAAVVLSHPSQAPDPQPASRYTNRYFLSATVAEMHPHGWIVLVDDNGDEWYYNSDELHSGQRVMLIVDNHGTLDDLCDDTIEDVLYCDGAECKED
jgi:hypothetical protein